MKEGERGFKVTVDTFKEQIITGKEINLSAISKGEVAMLLLELEHVKELLLKISNAIPSAYRSVKK